MSKMIFPSYQFELDGLNVRVVFREFGYTSVVPVIFEMKIGFFGGKWEQVSNSYWHDAMDITSFIRGDDSRRMDFARTAAEKWRQYRKGWEVTP